MRFRRIQTADNSQTIQDSVLDVTYRSTHGAKTESEHVFVSPVLTIPDGERRIFELGLGTGCNLEQFLTAWKGPLVYWAVDWCPLEAEFFDGESLAQALILAVLEDAKTHGIARTTHGRITFVLEVCPVLESTCPEGFEAHAIFHDPFGPDTNPESWSEEIFAWEAKRLAPEGLVLTYSAAGIVRRAMAAAGLHIATRPGPGWKREVTVAALSKAALSRIADGKIMRKYHG